MNPFQRLAPAFLLPFTVLLAGMVFPCSAENETGRKQTIHERRPCGPDCIKGPLRYLFFQGCAGADFRSACVRHDACYDTIGSSQAQCDLNFLNQLLAEAGKSKFPGHARFRAHLSYWAVSVAGRSAWLSAQELAISKANGTYVAPGPDPARFTGIFAGFAKMAVHGN